MGKSDPFEVLVLGAGIVGVTAALELQSRGRRVVLLDRGQPGRETSYGNSGVLSDASIVIVNNPGLRRQLPKLVLNRSAKLRYDPYFVLRRMPWLFQFLSFCTERHFEHAASVLRALQILSLKIHKDLISRAGVHNLFRTTGWLKLFRTAESFQAYDLERRILDSNGVRYSVFEGEKLSQLEPGLKVKFLTGVLMEDTCSVASPAALCDVYLDLFEADGGDVREGNVTMLARSSDNHWEVSLENNRSIQANNVVVAAGPWSAEIAGWLRYRIPMAWERGYHLHLEPGPGPAPSCPIHDVDRGYVMSPQQQGIRVTSGVELAYRDAPRDFRQINTVAAVARETAGLGPPIESVPWMGCRPTLPDSLPMIGPATRHNGLWFDFGHQHIGLGTSTGSANILADMMDGVAPTIAASAFHPSRFRI